MFKASFQVYHVRQLASSFTDDGRVLKLNTLPGSYRFRSLKAFSLGKRASGKSLIGAVSDSEANAQLKASSKEFEIGGLHHVGLLCENTEESLKFYCGVLGLEINPDRPDSRLPYKGAWLWVGQEMVHLMELPNPDPTSGRPEHGGRDRHACFVVRNVPALSRRLEAAGIPYTMSKSGRAAIFTRDPDGNALEFSE